MSNQSGILYVVATPIGNLGDITDRAKRTLADVDIIAAEDTRHSMKLLKYLGNTNPVLSYHDFNERKVTPALIKSLLAGKSVALISDAGTPLINDPGYHLVNQAHAKGVRVVPIPGASAVLSALQVSGLPTDKFTFEGFAPERTLARRTYFQQLRSESRTMVFYEAPHRIMAFLEDASAVFGYDRKATLARELTKKYETIRRSDLGNLLEWLTGEEQQRKGEFVVVIQGANPSANTDQTESTRILTILLKSLPVKAAAVVAAEITGGKKNEHYKLALKINKGS